jgi:hypothetical protein
MHVPHFLVSTLPRALADTLQSVAVVAATQNAEVDKLVHRDIQPSQPYTHHIYQIHPNPRSIQIPDPTIHHKTSQYHSSKSLLKR